MSDASPAEVNAKHLSLAEYLESSPPDTQLPVNDLGVPGEHGPELNGDDIHLPCDNQECEGKGALAFAFEGGRIFLERGKWKFTFVTFNCRNCTAKRKKYALALRVDDNGRSGLVLKLGELPTFGPEVPARVITLIGPDRELFLAGRRAENRGMGIGAFAYYRRVVENQKGRIIQEVAQVARKMGAKQDVLNLFEAAAKETQFAKAIETINAAIPSALRINGHNPLTLVHTALSDGLHDRTDAECLECAREIRLILTELAERMSQVLKEKSELDEAVGKLLERTGKKQNSTPPGPTESK